MTGGAKRLSDYASLKDEAPSVDALTAYDEAHMAIYLQLLYGDGERHDISRLAAEVFGVNADAEPERAQAIVHSHLSRAKWLCTAGAKHF